MDERPCGITAVGPPRSRADLNAPKLSLRGDLRCAGRISRPTPIHLGSMSLDTVYTNQPDFGQRSALVPSSLPPTLLHCMQCPYGLRLTRPAELSPAPDLPLNDVFTVCYRNCMKPRRRAVANIP